MYVNGIRNMVIEGIIFPFPWGFLGVPKNLFHLPRWLNMTSPSPCLGMLWPPRWRTWAPVWCGCRAKLGSPGGGGRSWRQAGAIGRPPPSRKFGRQDPGRQSHRWTKEVLKQRMQALGPCGVALSFTQTVSKAMVSGVMSALTCTFTHECQLQWKALIRSEPP